jgi:hypothetical protein
MGKYNIEKVFDLVDLILADADPDDRRSRSTSRKK